MEEADNLLILNLKDYGCPIEDGITTLAQFEPDVVYKACLCYVRLIDESKAEPFSESFPRGMSSRVNVATNMAAAIKELGYRAELNYHQLLYPNPNDLRKLLMWLQQAVPQKTDEPSASTGGVSSAKAILSDQISKALANIPKETWIPWQHHTQAHVGNTSRSRNLRSLKLHTPVRGRAVKTTPGLDAYYTKYLPPITAQPLRRDDIPPSVFETNLSAYADAQERENEWNTSGLSSGLNPTAYKDTKLKGILSQMAYTLRTHLAEASRASDSAANLSRLMGGFEGGHSADSSLRRKVEFIQESEAPALEPKVQVSEEERLAKQQQEIADAQLAVSKITNEIQQFEKDVQSLESAMRQFEAGTQDEDTKRETLEKEYRIKKRTYELLADADKNIDELQKISGASSVRLVELASEWEKHRVPMLEQIRSLKDEQMNKQDETKTKLEQIKEMRARLRQLVEEIQSKEEHYQQLLEAYAALPKDLTRAVYTRRILEIVKNVKKQKVDINKILLDTRNLRKEINTVSETLGRVFAIVDELVFQDANVRKDPTAVQAYKHFAAMDEGFKKLVRVIEETGVARTSVLTLESKSEQIQLRTNTLNVDRLEKDLEEIKQENQKLIQKIKARGN
eukprot:TRINITY_DN16665_c0_g1_i2.p1 TRINITY_DN16665_c0_g1~~TRINITY_DN16665_c0_g1_i2.p1  ORF type:complete len:624 (-),score=205.72 TRINITY_DN16665_c0_g1_i2:48-1919(-)